MQYYLKNRLCRKSRQIRKEKYSYEWGRCSGMHTLKSQENKIHIMIDFQLWTYLLSPYAPFAANVE